VLFAKFVNGIMVRQVAYMVDHLKDIWGNKRMAKKPIRVFYSSLTQRFYATNRYKEISPGVIEATGEKFDVTNDIANLIAEYGIEFVEKTSG